MKKFILLSVKIIILTVIIQFCMVSIGSKEILTEIPYSEAVRLIEEVNTDIDEVDINIETNKVIFYMEHEGEITKLQTIVPNIEKFYEKIDEASKEKELETLVKITNNEEFSLYWYWPYSLLIALSIVLVLEKLKSIKKEQDALISKIIKHNTDDNIDFDKHIAKKVTTRFSDVAGMKNVKQEVEEVIDFIKNPSKYSSIGAVMPRGVLLEGPPGTGKTLLAKAIAGEANVPFIHISGSDFIEKYVGVGAKRVRDLFEKAREFDSCIIFIDEIDAIGKKRSNSTDEEYLQTLNQLLAEMDGFNEHENVFVLAATNRINMLDSALCRPKRFDRIIRVPLPNVEERVEILKVHVKNKKFSKDVDFREIASVTTGFSGAMLEKILNESAIYAARQKMDEINMECINEAISKVCLGLKSTKVLSDEEKKITAVHETGHTVLNLVSKTRKNVKEVSIIPRGNAGGYTMNQEMEEKNYISLEEMKEMLVCLMGGRIAEKKYLNLVSTGPSEDIKTANRIAMEMVTIYGMSVMGPISVQTEYEDDFLIYGENFKNEISDNVKKLISEAEKTAERLLEEHTNLFNKIVEELLIKETLNKKELEELVNSCIKTR